MSSGSGWPAESDREHELAAGPAVQPDHGERAERELGLLGQRAVDRRDRGPLAAGVLGDGPQRVAHEPGQGRRARTLAGHVADADGPARVGREGVVEVAADVVELPRRAVQRRRPQPGHRRQLRRPQALLQLARDLGALLRQPGVEHRDRGPAAELLGQRAVLVGERPRPAERQRPELAAAGAQPDDEPLVARGRLAPGARRRAVDVDRAPLRQIRDDDRRDAREALLAVRRGRQHPGRLAEDPLADLRVLDLRDVLDDVDDPVHASVGVAQDADLVEQPALLPGRQDDVAHELGLGVLLARERAERGQRRGSRTGCPPRRRCGSARRSRPARR